MEPDLRLYIVRHGQAEANQPWLFLGRTDSPLSSAGRLQAQRLGELLADRPVDAIHTSPLLRAHQTASYLAGSRDASVLVDDRLTEQDYGVWEGLTLDDVRRQYAGDFLAWQRGDLGAGPTGGESLGQVAGRAQSFYADLRRRTQMGAVALVAHGSILNALMCHLLQTPNRWLWPFRLQTGTVSEIWVYGAQATLISLNEH